VGLGEALGADCRPVPILLSHYHWDHLQGLPFFAPLYRPGFTMTLYAPSLEAYDAGWAQKIFDSPFFPLPFDRLPVPPSIQIIEPTALTIGPFEITALELNHPGGALAYRIKGDAGDLVYASDHEMGRLDVDRELVRFMRGASAAIVDAHFTPDEELAHRGWGHSTWAGAVDLATQAGVDRLWLFHHKPGRSDVELWEIVEQARERFANTQAAGEGDTFTV
jgi:phosphoribosyl 1,2-cyclic phosphodiesterase